MGETNETDIMMTDALEARQSDIGKELLGRRYLWKDAGGQVVEMADQTYMRVAMAAAGIDLQCGASSDDVRCQGGMWCELRGDGKFLPNTPALVNAGSVP